MHPVPSTTARTVSAFTRSKTSAAHTALRKCSTRSASWTVYETKQLRVKGDNPDALLPEIRKICSNIESEVKVIAPEEEKEESSSHPLAEMLIGAALFVAGLLIPAMAVKLVLLIAAYLLLGRHVLLTAAVRYLTKTS